MTLKYGDCALHGGKIWATDTVLLVLCSSHKPNVCLFYLGWGDTVPTGIAVSNLRIVFPTDDE